MIPIEIDHRLLMESFFQKSLDTISIMDTTGVLRYVNPTFEAVYGLSASEAIGRSVIEIWPETEDNIHQIKEHMMSGNGVSEYELQRTHAPSGKAVYVSITVSPIQDASGFTYAYVTVGRDITEKKLTEQLLLQTEKLSVVGQLGAALAHEIRNPLTSVKGFIQLLREKWPGPQDYFNIIASEVNRIEQIINEFLMSSKPTVSALALHDLRRILEQSVLIIQPEAHMNNVEIRVADCLPNLPIRGDENKLKQVFLNILKNAVESMTRGGIIFVDANVTDNHMVCVKVTDKGSGIPPHLMSRLGTPFYTTKERGTGLGLTVSSQILHEHAGSLRFESEVGKGTTVYIQVPIHE